MKYKTFKEALEAFDSKKDSIENYLVGDRRFQKYCEGTQMPIAKAFYELTKHSMILLKTLAISEEKLDYSSTPLEALGGLLIESGNYFSNSIKDRAKVSCKKECSWCCSLSVGVSTHEALLVYSEYFLKFGEFSEEQNQRLKKQAESGPEYSGLTYEEKKCVFLKDGLCSVYEFRPIKCAGYAVASSPSLCETNARGTGNDLVTEVFDGAALVEESALYTLISIFTDRDEEFGTLHEILHSKILPRLEREKDGGFKVNHKVVRI